MPKGHRDQLQNNPDWPDWADQAADVFFSIHPVDRTNDYIGLFSGWLGT